MVSVLGLGTTGWGAHPEFGEVDAEGAKRQTAIALDAGINLFDTAETYGDGRCEELLGTALAGRRDEAIIATKVFFGTSQSVGSGLSRRHIVDSCEGSLKRLGTDRIDLLQMHGWDGTVPLEETLSATRAPLDRFWFDWRGGRRPSSNYEGFDDLAALIARHQPEPNARGHPYWSDPEPCAMHIDEVEALWAAIDERDDWAPLNDKLAAIRRMGEAHRANA